jgi:hypothetical protein
MDRQRLAAATALVVLVAAPVVLAGCVSRRLAFEKPGASVEDRRRDQALCLRAAADDPARSQLMAAYRIDRDAYSRCMAALGYTLVAR